MEFIWAGVTKHLGLLETSKKLEASKAFCKAKKYPRGKTTESSDAQHATWQNFFLSKTLPCP